MPFAPLISVVNLYDSPIPPSIFSCPLDNVIFVRSLCVNESGLIWMWRYEQLVVVHFLWIRIYGCAMWDRHQAEQSLCYLKVVKKLSLVHDMNTHTALVSCVCVCSVCMLCCVRWDVSRSSLQPRPPADNPTLSQSLPSRQCSQEAGLSCCYTDSPLIGQ